MLRGAPAIAAAVDVHASAIVRRVPGPDNILADPRSGKRFRYGLTRNGSVQWRGYAPGARGAVLEALLETLADRPWSNAANLPTETRLDTDAFYATVDGEKVKLGLGSSAAVLVALAGARLAALGMEISATELREVCCEAHRKFQGGRGSGIDVVTSLEGGIVAVSLCDGTPWPDVSPLCLPEGLFIVPVWSGTGASTPRLLSRFDAYARRDPGRFRRHMDRLGQVAAAALEAWRGGSPGEIIQGLRRYDAALQSMDREGAIGIYTPPHRELARICEDRGAFYKISGAGGGDFGLACGDSAAIMDSLVKHLRAAGYLTLSSPGSQAGLKIINGSP